MAIIDGVAVSAAAADAPPDGHTPAEVKAALRLQRFVRSERARRALRLVTSKETIHKLKAMFFDQRALRAGADSNPLYATAVLSSRNQLRMDAKVVAALAQAWKMVKAALRIANDADCLTFDQYEMMSRKLYLHLHASEGSVDFTPSDFEDTTEREWVQDTSDVSPDHDEGVFDQKTFNKSWFELADVNTVNVDAREYATFLRRTTAALFVKRNSGGVAWRPDVQLLDDIRARIERADVPIYTTRRGKWEAAFPEDSDPYRGSSADGVPRVPGERPDHSLRRGDTRNWPRLPLDRMGCQMRSPRSFGGSQMASSPKANRAGPDVALLQIMDDGGGAWGHLRGRLPASSMMAVAASTRPPSSPRPQTARAVMHTSPHAAATAPISGGTSAEGPAVPEDLSVVGPTPSKMLNISARERTSLAAAAARRAYVSSATAPSAASAAVASLATRATEADTRRRPASARPAQSSSLGTTTTTLARWQTPTFCVEPSTAATRTTRGKEQRPNAPRPAAFAEDADKDGVAEQLHPLSLASMPMVATPPRHPRSRVGSARRHSYEPRTAPRQPPRPVSARRARTQSLEVMALARVTADSLRAADSSMVVVGAPAPAPDLAPPMVAFTAPFAPTGNSVVAAASAATAEQRTAQALAANARWQGKSSGSGASAVGCDNDVAWRRRDWTKYSVIARREV